MPEIIGWIWWHMTPRSKRPTPRMVRLLSRTPEARLMEALQAAYADIDSVPYDKDPDRSAQAIGRYDGLKQAYILLTGRKAQDVANDVVSWYVSTPEYQQRKQA